MDFAQAWNALAVGDHATASNGQLQPTGNPDGFACKVWRSHNFTGQLVEKIDAAPRALRFDLPADENGSIIGYTLQEGAGHTFTQITAKEAGKIAEAAGLSGAAKKSI